VLRLLWNYVPRNDTRETAKKRYRILPAGDLGVPPKFKKSPKIGGYAGLIETISAVSIQRIM
jgi:hypothetical protein